MACRNALESERRTGFKCILTNKECPFIYPNMHDCETKYGTIPNSLKKEFEDAYLKMEIKDDKDLYQKED